MRMRDLQDVLYMFMEFTVFLGLSLYINTLHALCSGCEGQGAGEGEAGGSSDSAGSLERLHSTPTLPPQTDRAEAAEVAKEVSSGTASAGQVERGVCPAQVWTSA